MKFLEMNKFYLNPRYIVSVSTRHDPNYPSEVNMVDGANYRSELKVTELVKKLEELDEPDFKTKFNRVYPHLNTNGPIPFVPSQPDTYLGEHEPSDGPDGFARHESES